MNYVVEWMPPALNQLAAVWMDAADRSAVTAASHRIDARLADDPVNEGESRPGNQRITFEAPLRVLFRVFEAERKVEVIAVGAFAKRA